jgi:hypothetical protein
MKREVKRRWKMERKWERMKEREEMVEKRGVKKGEGRHRAHLCPKRFHSMV